MKYASAIRRGARAFVTGASSGIGAAFARELGDRGLDVIVTARREDRLRELAHDIRERSGVEVETIPADLANTGDLARVADAVRGRIDVLINNAGFGMQRSFVALDPARDATQIALNCGALVAIAHAVVPGMAQRGSGAIVNVASTAAFQAVPYMAVYGATKAFVLSFSVALAAELERSGVQVSALCPGPTETEFFRGGDVERVRLKHRTAEQVVATGLRALERGRLVAIDGAFNTALVTALRFFPRSLVARIGERAMRPRTT